MKGKSAFIPETVEFVRPVARQSNGIIHTAHALRLAERAGLQASFTYPGMIESWVGLGVEEAAQIFKSRQSQE